MILGALGGIAFKVSADTIMTFKNVAWSGKASYAEHKIHLKKSKLEFTGAEPERISFDIHLSAYFGVSPLDEIRKLREYVNSGEPKYLILGRTIMGAYKWAIVGYKIAYENYDKLGNLASATITVDLAEYVR